MNDSPVDCQNASVTEPQREGDRRMAVEGLLNAHYLTIPHPLTREPPLGKGAYEYPAVRRGALHISPLYHKSLRNTTKLSKSLCDRGEKEKRDDKQGNHNNDVYRACGGSENDYAENERGGGDDICYACGGGGDRRRAVGDDGF